MRNKKKLILEQLDRKLKPFKNLETIVIPSNGWIYTIRKSLNMTLQQLGNKVNISRQGMKNIEQREKNGTITLRSLTLIKW